MPLRPDHAHHAPSPHVLRYANQVARLRRGDVLAGHVLVQPDVFSTQVSGHLWWRRWAPSRDALWLWTVVDGNFSDHYVREPDAVFEETQMWDRGAFEHYGEILVAEWLTGWDADEVKSSVFGV